MPKVGPTYLVGQNMLLTHYTLILETCKHITIHSKEVKVGRGVKIPSYLILRNMSPGLSV